VHPNTPSAPYGAEQESIFKTFFGDLEVGVVDLAVIDRLFWATSKKGQLF